MDNTLQTDLAACVDNIEYMDMAIARDQCNVAESKEDALNGAVRFLRTHAPAIAEPGEA